MPLSSLDIEFYYTGNATGPQDNTLSLGGTKSPYTITSGQANNIFDDVTGDEAETGDTEYRGIAIYINTINSAGSFDAIRPRIYISGYSRATSGADTLYIAASTFGLNANTMGTCTDESSAPNETGLTWVSEDSGETIYFNSDGSPTTVQPSTEGTLKSENWVGLWIKRVVPANATPFNDRSCTIVFRCETTASPETHLVEKIFTFSFDEDSLYVVKINI